MNHENYAMNIKASLVEAQDRKLTYLAAKRQCAEVEERRSRSL